MHPSGDAPGSRIGIFDRHADDYDRWFDDHPDIYRQECALVKNAVGHFRSGLEIGAGTGRFAVPLGIRVGVEPARSMARIARRRGVEVVRGIGECLPLKSGSFDLVLMVTVICFMQNVQLALSEAHRVLEPGGRIILAFLEREGRIARKYIKDSEKSRFLRHANFYSRAEIEQRLGEAGFSGLHIASLTGGFAVIAAEKA
ncbi:MAG: methyltransferase domain-containing protein [Methanomicrobiaceae archaeon]|nr:methyltransferase domain-containing protein [Methanomicrobiaceae archaeon]